MGTTAVIAVCTVGGLAAAGGTYAFLNAGANMPGAKISAGTLDLQINGKAADALGAWNLTPAAPQAKSFTITNVGDVDVTLSAAATIDVTSAIAANVQARITPVANAAACTVGLTGTRQDLAAYSQSALDAMVKSTTQTYCLELSLKAGTPVSQSGQGLSFTMTMTGTQKAN